MASKEDDSPAPAISPHQRKINNAIKFCREREWHILESALKHCWTNNFLGVFRQFFKDHAAHFRGMKRKDPLSGEWSLDTGTHSHQQHEDFEEYLKLYESQLADYIENHPDGPGATVTEFYRELKAAQECDFADEGTQMFIDCLVASADYDSFYSVMVREADMLPDDESESKFDDRRPDIAEAKCESKADYDDNPKGGRGGGSYK